MMVTTGARWMMLPASSSASAMTWVSRSFSLMRMYWCPISSATSAAVSWSSTWLMVTIEPSFIMILMSSPALTLIFCASSPTVMVSGMRTSRETGATGFSNLPPLRSRSRLLPPLPPRPPALAPPLRRSSLSRPPLRLPLRSRPPPALRSRDWMWKRDSASSS